MRAVISSVAELVGAGLVLWGAYGWNFYAGLIVTGAALVGLAQLPTDKDQA